MKIIAVTNQKGGTGKTTSTINIGAGLSRLGQSVLLIDLDPQANLSFSLGLPDPGALPNVYQLLTGQIALSHAVSDINGLGLIPSSPLLVNLETDLASRKNKATLLQQALAAPLDWDYILLDCPPSSGLITLNALTAAQELYVPVQAEFLALQGMSKLLETIDQVRRDYNPSLMLAGIIATRYDQRRVLNREVIGSLSEHFGNKLFNTYIHENIALAEAPSFGQDIFSYRPDSNGARDYMALCREIVERR